MLVSTPTTVLPMTRKQTLTPGVTTTPRLAMPPGIENIVLPIMMEVVDPVTGRKIPQTMSGTAVGGVTVPQPVTLRVTLTVLLVASVAVPLVFSKSATFWTTADPQL